MFKPVGIFLLSLFVFTQVYNTAMWVNYEMNIEEITDLFCENTDKPELNCHGTCHLKKQIISSEGQDPIESNTLFYLNEIQLFSSSETSNLIVLIDEEINHQSFIGLNYSYLEGKSLFHPPQA